MSPDIYVHFHIPRTGGTSFQNHIGTSYNRKEESCWYHYHWSEGISPSLYSLNDLPILRHRTKEQQKKIKFLTGHSTFSNSHRWLKVSRTPRFITFVRDPVERILSSFNHRHSRRVLTQDSASFSASPLMNTNAVSNQNTADDYDTLYEFYKDAYVEHNLQTKWIVKSFMRWNDHGGWQHHPTYDGNLEYGVNPHLLVPITMPEWFWWDTDYDYWSVVQPLLEKFWWISTLDNFKDDVKDLCHYAEINFHDNVYENKSGEKIAPYWTIDDVKKQPDFHRLIEEEKHDYSLFNFVKQYSRRPF